MESIRDIALTFCATSVFTAALTLLNGKVLEKSGRYIIALIMLCSVIGSLQKADFRLDLPESTPASEETVQEISLSEYQAGYLVGQILKKSSVNFTNISAKATKNEDGSIVINEIVIEGVKDMESAASVLSASGIDCRVIFR